MPDSLPANLGRYQILDELGRGGFATVYRAADSTLGREVALKVLDPLLMRDATFVARFQREARAAAGLEHPQIVPLYDVGEAEGRLYLAMRLVRGGSLARRLREQGRMRWDEALRILTEAGKGLAYAHEQGIVHRDIKPDNILLDETSGALLGDFGFARLVGSASLTLSFSGGIVGTPAYIPPEIWDGEEATPPTDIYALACVLYEMLTGAVLFRGETPIAILRAHDRGATLPAEWPGDVPPGVAPVLTRALARQCEARYSTVAAFVDALTRVETAAMAERMGTEVARLYHEADAAYQRRQFAQSHEVLTQLIALQPDHGEARAMLREVQTQEQRQTELRAQVMARRGTLEAAVARTTEQREALAERRATLEAERAALESERATLEAQKREVETQLGRLVTAHRQSGDALDALAREESRHAQEASAQRDEDRRIQQLLDNIEQGDLEAAARAVGPAQVSRPDTSDRTTAATSRPPLTASARHSLPEARALAIHAQYQDPVSCLAFSPDTRYLAAGSPGGCVTVWDLDSVPPLSLTIDQQPSIADVAFSPDGLTIAAACQNGEIRTWAVHRSTEPRILGGHQASARALAFSPQDPVLASGDAEGRVLLWDTRQWTRLKGAHDLSLPRSSAISGLTFSPGGTRLTCAGQCPVIPIWSAPEYASLWTLESRLGWSQHLAFSPDGEFLAVATTNKVIQIWQVETQRPVYTLKLPHIPTHVAYVGSGTLLACVSKEGVQLLDIETGELVRQLPRSAGICISFASARNGSVLASGDKNGEIRLWRFEGD